MRRFESFDGTNFWNFKKSLIQTTLFFVFWGKGGADSTLHPLITKWQWNLEDGLYVQRCSFFHSKIIYKKFQKGQNMEKTGWKTTVFDIEAYVINDGRGGTWLIFGYRSATEGSSSRQIRGYLPSQELMQQGLPCFIVQANGNEFHYTDVVFCFFLYSNWHAK